MKTALLITLYVTLLFPQPHIAVSSLEVKNGVDSSEVELITDRLRLELYKTGNAVLIERDEMKAILQEQGFQASGMCSDESCLVEMGQLLGAQYIVTGSIGKVGSLILVNLRSINVETGAVDRVSSRDISGGMENVISQLPEMANALLTDTKPAVTTPSDDRNGLRLQLYLGTTVAFSPVASFAGGAGASLGYQKNRHCFRFNGDFYAPYGFVAGAGFSYGYDLVENSRYTVMPNIFLGYWYGDDKTEDTEIEHISNEFGAIALYYEVGSSTFSFFVEPMLRMGSLDDIDSEGNVERTDFSTRFIANLGLVIHL